MVGVKSTLIEKWASGTNSCRHTINTNFTGKGKQLTDTHPQNASGSLYPHI